MSMSFFKALNPTAKHTEYFYEGFDERLHEIVDLTVSEDIHSSSNQNIVSRIFNILVGNHSLIVHPEHSSTPPAKGVLDFLIFPLVARALIWVPDSMIAKIVGLAIAIPLEIARFSLGISLTLLLAPIVALIDAIQNCLPKNSLENTQSVPNATT